MKDPSQWHSASEPRNSMSNKCSRRGRSEIEFPGCPSGWRSTDDDRDVGAHAAPADTLAAVHPSKPQGVPVFTTGSPDVEQLAPEKIPAPIGVVPYAIVPDATEAITWYGQALGACMGGDPVIMDDGRIGHAELVINGGIFYLASAFPEQGFEAPVPGVRPSVTMHLTVPDVDAIVKQAVAAGANLERPPTDNPYGRGGVFVDPFGHRWIVHQDVPSAEPVDSNGSAVSDASADVDPSGAPASVTRPPLNGDGQGDISYLTLKVSDSTRARTFYGSVLGWTFEPGRVDDGWQVVGVQPMTGMWGGGDAVEVSTMVPMYRVDDIGTAVERVRAAGGTATDPEQEPYGWSSDCVDDQGGHFYLGQH